MSMLVTRTKYLHAVYWSQWFESWTDKRKTDGSQDVTARNGRSEI